MDHYKLSNHLKQKADSIDNKRSSEYTCLSLLAGAAKLNESKAHAEIRIPQLCNACNISRATFYLHFNGKDELMVRLMEHLTDLEHLLSPVHDASNTVEATLRQIVNWYFSLHFYNGNLFLNLSILNWSDPRINALWMVRAEKLHDITYGLLSKHKEFRALSPEYAQFAIEFVGSGMNSAINRANSNSAKNPFIPEDIGVMTEYSVVVFYQSLFGKLIPGN